MIHPVGEKPEGAASVFSFFFVLLFLCVFLSRTVQSPSYSLRLCLASPDLGLMVADKKHTKEEGFGDERVRYIPGIM